MTLLANAPHTKLAHPAWFHAEAIKPGTYDRNVVCRKSAHNSDQVIIHNGRHFIKHLSAEEARQQYRITRAVPIETQGRTESDFQWYLNY